MGVMTVEGSGVVGAAGPSTEVIGVARRRAAHKIRKTPGCNAGGFPFKPGLLEVEPIIGYFTRTIFFVSPNVAAVSR